MRYASPDNAIGEQFPQEKTINRIISNIYYFRSPLALVKYVHEISW